jgi:hypothetical protein
VLGFALPFGLALPGWLFNHDGTHYDFDDTVYTSGICALCSTGARDRHFTLRNAITAITISTGMSRKDIQGVLHVLVRDCPNVEAVERR